MATLTVMDVTDPNHPDLHPYRSLRRRKDLGRNPIFVAEGDKIVRQLLASPYRVESLLLTPHWLRQIQELLDRREDQIQVFLGTETNIEEITGFGCHQSIKAVGRITHPPALCDLLRRLPRPWLIGALEGICNAENMGAIVRNASALGVQALIVGETACSPFLTRSIRTSMGTVFGMPVVENVPLLQALTLLRAEGCRTVAAHPLANEVTLSETPFREDVCLILGSEGTGLTPETLAASDLRVSIPMTSSVDSLNVSSAAGIMFYEAWRQRHWGDH